MINKSIQSVDLANILQSTPQTAASSGSERGDGASFYSLFTGQMPDPPGKGNGKSSSISGNNLPEQGLQTETRAPAVDVATLAVDGPDDPVIAETKFITSSQELPVQPAGFVSSQHVRARKITGTSQEVMDNTPVFAGQLLTPGQLIARNEGQTLPSAEQVTGQVVGTSIPALARLPDQLTRQEVHPQPAGQQAPVSAPVIDPQNQSTVHLTGIQTQLPEQVVEQMSQPSDRVVAHQPQLSTLPAGPAADGRTVTQTVPVEIPVTGTDLLQKGTMIEAGQLNGQPAVKAFPAGDAGRISSSQDAVSNLVRETVQAVIVSQSGNGDLKQSLRDRRDPQPGGNTLAALARTDTNPLAFLQTLSESSPFTLPSARVQVPVGQHGWGEAVGQQVTWFVSQNVSAANLRLSPQHLGPMEMQINMDGDKANVSFLSQHAIVRDALESSLPRLREMLAESGLDLVNVNISQHGASDQKGRGLAGFQQGADVSRTDSGFNEAEIDENVQQAPAVAYGLIDAYA